VGPKPQTYFVSAASGVNTSVLRAELNARGIRESQPDVSPGHAINDGVIAALRGADIVCCVLDALERPNVLFELGIATGLRKPILLFATTGVDLPFDLSLLPIVRADVSSKDTVSLQLDAFLRRSASRRAGTSIATTKRPPVQLNALEARLNAAERGEPRSSARKLESIVHDILLASADMVVNSEEDKPGAPDLVIWLDDVQDILGNPIPVEVKWWSRPSQAQILSTTTSLRTWMRKRGAKSGLLVYASKHPAILGAPQAVLPVVIPVSVRELLEWTQHGAVAAELRRRRNAVIHGGR
jgi:hypothetical protein